MESEILKRLMIALSRINGVRIFRNNTGMGWQGEKVNDFTKDGARFVILKGARPLHAGLFEGSPDLIGWRTVTISPEMVGKKIAVFLGVEAKTEKGRASDAQKRFLDAISASGGLGLIARSEDDIKHLNDV